MTLNPDGSVTFTLEEAYFHQAVQIDQAVRTFRFSAEIVDAIRAAPPIEKQPMGLFDPDVENVLPEASSEFDFFFGKKD